MIASKFQLPFVKKKKLNHEVWSFYFDRSNFKIKYSAGQYFRTTLDIENPDKRGSSRYFTISSSPNEQYLVITTKIIKSSFKQNLYNLKKGEHMTFFGPFGELYQDKKNNRPKIMITGGMGITPAYSMLKFINEEKIKINFTLLAMFSKVEDEIFLKELKSIERKNKDIKIYYFFNRIDIKQILQHAPKIFDSMIIVSGSPAMVENVKRLVIQIGVEEEKIISEDFTGY